MNKALSISLKDNQTVLRISSQDDNELFYINKDQRDLENYAANKLSEEEKDIMVNVIEITSENFPLPLAHPPNAKSTKNKIRTASKYFQYNR